MWPPVAHPVFLLRNSRSRIGQGPSRVRPLQLVPPLVVVWTQPSTLGEISPPATQPSLSLLRKKTSPSKTGSTLGPQVQAAPALRLLQKSTPVARACRFFSRLNSRPNQPPSVSSTTELQSVAPAPPSVVYCAVFSAPLIRSRINPDFFMNRTRCTQPVSVKTMSLPQVLPPSWLQRIKP